LYIPRRRIRPVKMIERFFVDKIRSIGIRDDRTFWLCGVFFAGGLGELATVQD
jgi:hypothetical protein